METWDTILARRYVRSYDDRPIEPADLDRILEAGRRTTSSTNQQGWDLVVCTDRAQLRDLAGVWRFARHVADSAATIALVMPASDHPDERETYHYDLGQMTMSLMLAAADLGSVGGTPRWGTRTSLGGSSASPRTESAPGSWRSATRPLVPISRPDRRALEDMVHRGRWRAARR